MTALRMSADGRARLMQREGVRTRAYRDSKGVWTIGVGHTANAGAPIPKPGMVITRQEVDEHLSRDLVKYENIVNRNVRVPLTQGQFDSLVSICFNVETALLPKSTIVKRLNKGDYRGAANAIMLYNKPPEIIGRRESEQQQFIRATYALIAQEKRDAGEGQVVRLTAKDLRNAGSRTMSGADEVQTGVVGGGISAVGALGVASQVRDVASSVSETVATAADSVTSAHSFLGWLSHDWKTIAIIVLSALVVFFLWWTIRGARRVVHAKVDGTNEALDLGPGDYAWGDEEAGGGAYADQFEPETAAEQA
ncbi:lysozyme [Methylocystis rosea]|uniref:lysozyme n=1 Tax=Methylocystis rosea TaxID=173366 RepID=UPI0003A24041|nr:lysozyme [Methylocystis rosea]